MKLAGCYTQAIESRQLTRKDTCQLLCLASVVSARRLLRCGALCVLLLAMSSAYAWQPAAIDPGGIHAADPALGINDTFGRWNSKVRLVYDPDNAPSQYSQSKFLELLEQAIAQWERVSGIRFEITGVDRAAPDDANRSVAQRDGLVRIFWGQTQGFAGLAGPQFSNFDQSLGYYPYYDGDVTLNQDAASWDSDAELVSTLVHELGHLIGLGHSDEPVSIMYANPYTNLNFPRADDIAAVQALYGTGNSGVTPQGGVSEWRYSTPPVAAAGVTQFLFKPNEFTNKSAFISLESAQDLAVSTITDATAKNQFVMFNTGGIGGFTNTTAINVAATLVIVDPDGYVLDKSKLALQCNARSACGGGALGLVVSDAMKTYPGIWKFLVVDEAANTLLLTKTLEVTARTSINKAPLARVSAVQGATPAQVTLTLNVTDAENNDVTVTWHPPSKPLDNDRDGFNDGGLVEFIGNKGVAVQTFDYSQSGTYTLFVELKDNSVRYNGSVSGSSAAGDGFSNLLQLTLRLPLATGGVDVIAQYPFPASSGTDSGSNTSGNSTVGTATGVSTIAAAQAFTASTSTGGATTAAFTMGASKDSGTSTATRFKPGDSIQVAGAVKPQVADIGKSADLFVVIRALLGGSESWLYRDGTGGFRPWSRAIQDLKPAMETSSLQSGATVEVYKGQVGTGTFQVFLGYKLDSSNTLHFTPVPLQLNVTN